MLEMKWAVMWDLQRVMLSIFTSHYFIIPIKKGGRAGGNFLRLFFWIIYKSGKKTCCFFWGEGGGEKYTPAYFQEDRCHVCTLSVSPWVVLSLSPKKSWRKIRNILPSANWWEAPCRFLSCLCEVVNQLELKAMIHLKTTENNLWK